MKRFTQFCIALIVSTLIVSPVSAATYETEVTAGVNFRSKPSTDSSVYRLLPKGTDIHVIEQFNDYWLKIETKDGKVGYISANGTYTDYIAGSHATAKNGVNFRSSAKVANNKIGYIRKGDAVQVIQEVNQYWLKVNYKGKIGYASAAYFNYKGTSGSSTSTRSTMGSKIVATAKTYIGDFKYDWGSEPWNTNYKYADCSSFVQLVFNKRHGYDLPRTSKQQSKEGSYIKKSNLRAGDLVFFDTNGNGSINHVGIYTGNGKFIHSSPINKVGISNLTSGYWEDHYETARRVL